MIYINSFANPKTLQKKIALQKNFKLYRIHCVTISRLYKERYFKKFFEKNKDSKKVWEAINAIIDNNKNTQKSRQISLYINNVITTDDKAIANHFNKFLHQ